MAYFGMLINLLKSLKYFMYKLEKEEDLKSQKLFFAACSNSNLQIISSPKLEALTPDLLNFASGMGIMTDYFSKILEDPQIFENMSLRFRFQGRNRALPAILRQERRKENQSLPAQCPLSEIIVIDESDCESQNEKLNEGRRNLKEDERSLDVVGEEKEMREEPKEKEQGLSFSETDIKPEDLAQSPTTPSLQPFKSKKSPTSSSLHKPLRTRISKIQKTTPPKIAASSLQTPPKPPQVSPTPPSPTPEPTSNLPKKSIILAETDSEAPVFGPAKKFSRRRDVVYKTLLRRIRKHLFDTFNQFCERNNISNKFKRQTKGCPRFTEAVKDFYTEEWKEVFINSGEDGEEIFIGIIGIMMTHQFYCVNRSEVVRKIGRLIKQSLVIFSPSFYRHLFSRPEVTIFMRVLKSHDILKKCELDTGIYRLALDSICNFDTERTLIPVNVALPC